MGRGANSGGRGEQIRRTSDNLHVLAMQIVTDVVRAFSSDCVSTFPRGATLRVLDRKGGRRVLNGENDVTQLAGRILYFTLTQSQRREVWVGDPRGLVRAIAFGLYGDGAALRYDD